MKRKFISENCALWEEGGKSQHKKGVDFSYFLPLNVDIIISISFFLLLLPFSLFGNFSCKINSISFTFIIPLFSFSQLLHKFGIIITNQHNKKEIQK